MVDVQAMKYMYKQRRTFTSSNVHVQSLNCAVSKAHELLLLSFRREIHLKAVQDIQEQDVYELDMYEHDTGMYEQDMYEQDIYEQQLYEQDIYEQ